ncbi:MAG: radical SAM protein [Candidatus Thermoplasmatota archaeon]|nr:radical SAM protein [Candidatus Thermoplasmatota archaeon]
MKIKEITSKTALSPSKLPGLDYALNPYSGCSHQCKYCYVPTVLHLPRKKWGETIRVKRNLPLILSKELPRKKPGIIGISTVTDPYQPIEQKYHVTRYSLQQILKYDFPVQLQTKSKLVLEDIDLINKFSNAEIMISIGTNNDIHRKILEPYASSIKDRLKILDDLKDNQCIKTSVFLGPLYPTMKWNQIRLLLDIFIEKNVSTIMIDDFHLKPGLQNYLTPLIQQNKSLCNGFSHHVFQPSQWYQLTAEKIKKYVNTKSTKTKIVNAF